MPKVTMEDQCRVVADIIAHGGASCVFHSMIEPDVENIMRSSIVSIASDSGIRQFGSGVPHPRGYGTNTRVLGVYARERKIISMEEAVRKMTSQPAMVFKMKDRGLVKEGYAADLVLFDPNTVADRATFEKPHQYPDGIRYVLVNGQIVLAGEKMTGKLPGVPVYGPGKN